MAILRLATYPIAFLAHKLKAECPRGVKSFKNKCSVGPETSILEIEKLKAQLPFPREDFSNRRSDSPDGGKEKCSEGKGRDQELFY